MRPGWSVSRVPNCSAIVSGAWLGNMMPPGPEPDGLGVGGDVGDEHAGGRGRDGGHVVVLGVPDPPIAGALGFPGESDAALEAGARRLTLADDGQIEDGQRDGHGRGPFGRKVAAAPGCHTRRSIRLGCDARRRPLGPADRPAPSRPGIRWPSTVSPRRTWGGPPWRTHRLSWPRRLERYLAFRAEVDAGDKPWSDLVEYFTDDAVFVDPAWGRIQGIDAIREFLVDSMTGIEDWTFPVDKVFVDGDEVVVKYRQVLPDGRQQSAYTTLLVRRGGQVPLRGGRVEHGPRLRGPDGVGLDSSPGDAASTAGTRPGLLPPLTRLVARIDPTEGLRRGRQSAGPRSSSNQTALPSPPSPSPSSTPQRSARVATIWRPRPLLAE